MLWYNQMVFAVFGVAFFVLIFKCGWHFGRASAFRQSADHWTRLGYSPGLAHVESGDCKWNNEWDDWT